MFCVSQTIIHGMRETTFCNKIDTRNTVRNRVKSAGGKRMFFFFQSTTLYRYLPILPVWTLKEI